MSASDDMAALHEAIQAALAPAAGLQGGHLTKWVVIAEHALPGDRKAFSHASGTAGGAPLNSWEALGLLELGRLDIGATATS